LFTWIFIDMKIIITEDQNKKVKETVINYLDNNLTPVYGWDNKELYAEELEEDGEVFFHLDDDVDLTIWYTGCDNGYLSEPLPKGKCPVAVIPTNIYDSLEGFFGNLWKPIFKQWFQHHTGLPIKEVDSED